MKTLYTVRKCNIKDNEFSGPSHGSDDGEFSICGIEFNEKFWITHNTFDGEITCKKCLKILLRLKTIPERIKYNTADKAAELNITGSQ